MVAILSIIGLIVIVGLVGFAIVRLTDYTDPEFEALIKRKETEIELLKARIRVAKIDLKILDLEFQLLEEKEKGINLWTMTGPPELAA